MSLQVKTKIPERDDSLMKMKFVGHNIRCLRAYGLWPYEEKDSWPKKVYTCYSIAPIGIYFLFVTSGMIYMFQLNGGIQEILGNIIINLLNVNNIIKMLPFLIFTSLPIKPVLTLHKLETSVHLDLEQLEMRKKAEKHIRRLTDIFFIMLYVTDFIWIFGPLPLWSYIGRDPASNDTIIRRLPYTGWFPVPQSQYTESPYYEVFYVFQCMGGLLAVGIVSATNTFYYSVLLTACSHFRMLCYSFSNLHDNARPDSQMATRLGDSVAYHQQVLKYCDEVRDLLGGILFAQCILMCILICLFIFQATTASTNSAQFMVALALIVCEVGQLFLYCQFGSDLLQESLEVRQAAYLSDWQESTNLSLRKSLQIVIMRAQKPSTISALSFATISLDMFNKILRMSYSFFTLLSQLHEEDPGSEAMKLDVL